MTSTENRVFVIGTTGNVGCDVIRGLVKKDIKTTAYVRNETKAKELFHDELCTGRLSLVIGTYTTIEIYRKAIQGHTRLFLLINGDTQKPAYMSQVKEALGTIAFEQGVRQIIDVSSYNVHTDGNEGIIGYMHKSSEDKLWALADRDPDKRSLVILRPGAFMTNHFMSDCELIKHSNKFVSCGLPSSVTTWIDTKDIADCAVTILTEPIEKHDRLIYEMGSEVLSNEERAAIFTEILGRTIKYEQQSIDDFYKDQLVHGMSHAFIYDLIKLAFHGEGKSSTPQLAIVLGRPMRKLAEWFKENLERFQ